MSMNVLGEKRERKTREEPVSTAVFKVLYIDPEFRPAKNT